MKQFLFFLLLVTLLHTENHNWFVKLSSKQKQILFKTYAKGKQFNYGLTLTAIAWQESYFGKYPMNLSDPSFGVFHINIKSISKRHNKHSKWSQSRLAERLLFDYDFCFAEALAELKYWENYWKSKGVSRVWSHTVSSYNGGYKWNSKQAKLYLKAIKKKIRLLKKLLQKEK